MCNQSRHDIGILSNLRSALEGTAVRVRDHGTCLGRHTHSPGLFPPFTGKDSYACNCAPKYASHVAVLTVECDPPFNEFDYRKSWTFPAIGLRSALFGTALASKSTAGPRQRSTAGFWTAREGVNPIKPISGSPTTPTYISMPLKAWSLKLSGLSRCLILQIALGAKMARSAALMFHLVMEPCGGHNCAGILWLPCLWRKLILVNTLQIHRLMSVHTSLWSLVNYTWLS